MNSERLSISFEKSLRTLRALADTTCVNKLPNRFEFLKFYSIPYEKCLSLNESFMNEYSLLKKKTFKKQDIINDLNNFLLHDKFISWVDLTLFYVTQDSAFVGVMVLFCNTETEISFHCSIPVPPGKTTEEKYDVNDYVMERLNQIL